MRELGAGSWSFFGDPRAISHDGHTFTGRISTTGNLWVARYARDGQLRKQVIFRGLGRDDHNNPSLVFRRDGHLMVFFCPHSSSGGGAWPQDIALTGEGRPRIVYIRRTGAGDAYYYALHDGTRWQSRRIVAAGGNSAGATFDHDDPRYVYLSRQLGRWRQAEQWFTPDDGRTWSHRQLTADPSGFCVRPVTPRGLRDANRIVYVWGDDRTKSWRDFTTRVRALDF